MQHNGLNEEQVRVISLLYIPARMVDTIRNYSQLTEEKGYQPYEYRTQGLPQSEIAKNIVVAKFTISRELRCGSGLHGYRPRQAQQWTENRKANCSSLRIACHHWVREKELLREAWSPEALSECLKKNKGICVSHE